MAFNRLVIRPQKKYKANLYLLNFNLHRIVQKYKSNAYSVFTSINFYGYFSPIDIHYEQSTFFYDFIYSATNMIVASNLQFIL